MARSRGQSRSQRVDSYKHTEAESPLRPDVGTQAQFRKKKRPAVYRYDPSLSPALEWDEQSAREEGESLIRQILESTSLDDAKAAAEKLKALSRPFLNWAGKSERLSFDVPTLPLFVHERLSTEAILESVKSQKSDRQLSMFDLFGDPRRSITDQVLRPYEQGEWTNRMILGDSLVVMNSLLSYEAMGGQAQMIYIDPPYGVKFGSNFQPFIRKRDVKHGDDGEMTREPEMVQAYRDTWELGLHSYLTYLRDRFYLCRELLHPTGSIFVQISDENVHHVREVMDEVFGAENFCSLITLRKTGGLGSEGLTAIADYILWYVKDHEKMKYRQLYLDKGLAGVADQYRYAKLESGEVIKLKTGEDLPDGAKLFQPTSLHTMYAGVESCLYEFELNSKKFKLPPHRQWSTTYPNMMRLAEQGRIYTEGSTPRYIRYIDDFPVVALSNVWMDTGAGSFLDRPLYVVQTVAKAVQRCILMTTDPGDLVIDPTCGSGTTAYVAEQWGRRWITIDTSRVPLALARQRLLTATFPYHELRDESLGPVGGFVYKRKQNSKGEEVGGIVPHITLKSIANDEPPAEEVLVDRPEEIKNIIRVTAPFTVEALIPTPVDWEGDGEEDSGAAQDYGSFVDRMIEVLRKSPALHLDGNRVVTFKNIRPPAKTLSLSAEAMVTNGDEKPVALVFGPENGAVSEKLVFEAAREAHAKGYAHLYVVGFAIQPNARELVENCLEVAGVPATYAQATPDLMMGDLLKNLRSSQIFSVAGLPEIKIHRVKEKGANRYQVELLGLDVFDPVTMELDHRRGDDVPAWFLDTDYNNLCFRVFQAFFPRTSAWDNLKKALRADYEASVWEHLAGTMSAPFEAGDHNQIAVKVIDDRGNELLV
ncbi:MAG: site-specific DNA-methyltransferase, partial [Acidobacteriota bacterium]